MPGETRAVRVFVSSTFLDMKPERDELIKRVFPKLRKICEQRGVAWADVDLRWGIPIDEEKAEEHVLPVCVAEIDNCRPFFVALLGERYGWVPAGIPPALVDRHAWLAGFKGASVTEIEIRHGALNRPEAAGQVRFYFRDPAAVDSLEAAEQARYREPSPEGRAKLTALKDSIRESKLPVSDDWRSPQELGERVLRDFEQILDVLYPEGSQPDALEREAAEHDYFATSRRGTYVGRQEYFERLERHVESDDPPLAVLGAAGSGKSALLANWIGERRASHPHELAVSHFVGASPRSADWGNLLRRIIGEFNRRFDLGIEVPTQALALREEFARALYLAARRERVVVAIDGLNHLEDREGAPDLVWLPAEVPAGIRVVVSTLPGRPLNELLARGCPALTVEPLAPEERRELITRYLAQYAKKLGPQAMRRLADTPQTSNPLFLRTLLSELRVHGDHATLEKRIEHYLEAATVDQLYGRVLARYETDYSALVRDAMTLLWAARRGLSEPELLDMLGSEKEPLPAALWSPLYLAADESLLRREGLLAFSHEYLRRAVMDRYLGGEAAIPAVHQRIADYFDKAELSERKLEELPWQLSRAKNWQRLYGVLTSPDLLPAVRNAAPYEVARHWTEVEANSDLRMAQAYAPVGNAGLVPARYAHAVGVILADAGHLELAAAVQKRLMAHYHEAGEPHEVAVAMGYLANILYIWNDLERAFSMYEQSAALYKQTNDLRGVSVSLSNQGKILQMLGEENEANKRFEEQERICREIGYDAGLQSALRNRASILLGQGDRDEAAVLYEEQRRVSLAAGEQSGLAVSLVSLAGLAKDRGELDIAERLCSEAESVARSIGDHLRLAETLSMRASIRYAQADGEGFFAVLSEEEAARRAAEDVRGVREVLQRKAAWLAKVGRMDEMHALYEREIRRYREAGVLAELQIWLEALGVQLIEEGKLDRAMELFEEQEKICRELDHRRGLASCLGNQAFIFSRRGESDRALELWQAQAEIGREVGNRHSVQFALQNLGVVLWKRGDLQAALERFLEQEKLCRELGHDDVLQTCMQYQGQIFSAMGQRERAAARFTEQARICRALGKKRQLADALAHAAQMRFETNHLEGAHQLLREEALVRRELGDESQLKRSLRDQAVVLEQEVIRLMDYSPAFPHALQLAREACEAAAESGDEKIKESTRKTLSALLERRNW